MLHKLIYNDIDNCKYTAVCVAENSFITAHLTVQMPTMQNNQGFWWKSINVSNINDDLSVFYCL